MPSDNHDELQKFIDLNEHYRIYLDEHDNCRPDGRQLTDGRDVQILERFLQHSNGSAMVRFGNTTVICAITGQLTKPSLKSLRSGFIQTVALLPRTQAWTAYGRRQQIINENLTLSQYLLDIILKSKMINLEDLCIEEGKWVWCLQIDFQCLNNDGNLLDACLLALNIALGHTHLAHVTIDPDTQKPLVYTKQLVQLKLNLDQAPLCCTIGVYQSKQQQQQQQMQFLVDPTLDEETIALSLVHFVLLKNDQICLLHKTAGAPFSTDKFQQCYSLARDYIGRLRSKFDQN